MGHKSLLARLWLRKDVCSRLNCSMQKWLISHLANSLHVPRWLCWSCTLFSISTGSTFAQFPWARGTCCVPGHQRCQPQPGGDFLQGTANWNILSETLGCSSWTPLPACCGSTSVPVPLSESTGLLVRWRKYQHSPRSGEWATKGLTLLPKSHIPGAAVSFLPSPWGLACLSSSVSILPCAIGEGAGSGREIQGQSWVRVLLRDCWLGSFCGRQRLSVWEAKQSPRQICIISGG